MFVVSCTAYQWQINLKLRTFADLAGQKDFSIVSPHDAMYD